MSRSGRVLILVENLSVPFDRRVWLEATTLRQAGYTVSVICPKGTRCDTASFEEIGGIRIYRYRLPQPDCARRILFLSQAVEYVVMLAHTARLCWKLHKHEGFDVIHACNPPDLFWLIAAPFRRRGCKFIYDQHDLCPEMVMAQFKDRVPRWMAAIVYRLLRRLEKTTYRMADAVLATNETLRAIAAERGPVPEERLFVVRTGTDSARLRPAPPDAALRGGRPHLVCYLGVMGRQDGVEYALAAAQRLLARRPRLARFVFIGDGNHAGALRSMARDLGIEEDVLFTGRIPDAELCQYLATADVCLSPDPANGFNEFHTMNKTLEYMTMGRPVVAFDLAETRWSAGAGALYATPNDVGEFASLIEQLLDDPALRAQLGEAGRRRIEERLSWPHQAPNLLAAYEAVLG